MSKKQELSTMDINSIKHGQEILQLFKDGYTLSLKTGSDHNLLTGIIYEKHKNCLFLNRHNNNKKHNICQVCKKYLEKLLINYEENYKTAQKKNKNKENQTLLLVNHYILQKLIPAIVQIINNTIYGIFNVTKSENEHTIEFAIRNINIIFGLYYHNNYLYYPNIINLKFNKNNKEYHMFVSSDKHDEENRVKQSIENLKICTVDEIDKNFVEIVRKTESTKIILHPYDYYFSIFNIIYINYQLQNKPGIDIFKMLYDVQL